MVLYLPAQGAVDRTSYTPFMRRIGIHEEEEPPGSGHWVTVAEQWGEPPPAFNRGTDVGDPAPCDDHAGGSWCSPL